MLKRIFDFIFSIIIIISLISIILLLSIVIKFTSEGPILYWSKRVGKNNKEFYMPKFRTMKIQTPAVATHLLKNPKDYITPLGAFLRKFSLDELPQFFNVLKGEMSIVGPRPLFTEDTKLFDSNYMRRLNVMPGITGLLQINERNTSDFERWYKYDIEYIENWSLFLDFKIIMKTPFSLFSSRSKGV